MEKTGEDWARKSCTACRGGVPPLGKEEAERCAKEIPGWGVSSDAKAIRARYVMKDFAAAVRLVGDIAEVAEREGHHPDVHLTGYRNLDVELSTHKIGGLSENDFILAAKISALPKELKQPR